MYWAQVKLQVTYPSVGVEVKIIEEYKSGLGDRVCPYMNKGKEIEIFSISYSLTNMNKQKYSLYY